MNIGDLETKTLGPDDASLMENVAPEVFDGEISAESTRIFLSD